MITKDISYLLTTGVFSAPFEAFVLSTKCRVALITDTNLQKIWGQRLCDQYSWEMITIKPGEAHKTRKSKAEIEDQLLEKGYGRDTLIIALGGGVVSDLAGFVAATYCRGVKHILIPTTLLAMVDACIGGKVGINHPYGKNLIGAFYDPIATCIDLDLLDTLPEEEWPNGFSEMIKHGVIYDEGYLKFLEGHAHALKAKDPATLQQAIERSIEIKSAIVQEDLQERGKRRILNFGHTLGHAFEKRSSYRISHGRAIAAGAIFAAVLSCLSGGISWNDVNRIERAFSFYHEDLLSLFRKYRMEDLWEILLYDKKVKKGQSRFVLLEEIGKPFAFDGSFCMEVSYELFQRTWREIQK